MHLYDTKMIREEEENSFDTLRVNGLSIYTVDVMRM